MKRENTLCRCNDIFFFVLAVIVVLTKLRVGNLLADSPAVEEVTSNREHYDADDKEHSTHEGAAIKTASLVVTTST